MLDVQVDGVAIVGRRGMSAWLNEPGHAAANEAARVLQSALPHVDWDALDRADADAMAAIGSLGPSRAKKLVFGVFALIAMALAIGAIIAFKFRRQIDAHGAPGHEINIDVKIPEVKFDGEALGRQLNESAKKQWESRPRVPPPTLHLPSPAQLSDEKPPQSN